MNFLGWLTPFLTLGTDRVVVPAALGSFIVIWAVYLIVRKIIDV